MSRHFGLTSRPGVGGCDSPAGSSAAPGWRNYIQSSDGGVESRHASPNESGDVRRDAGRLDQGPNFAKLLAGIAPGPSDSIQSTVLTTSRARPDYGAQMRRTLSMPRQALNGPPQAVAGAYGERDGQHRSKGPRRDDGPCDVSWGNPLPPHRSPLSQAAIDTAAVVTFALIPFLALVVAPLLCLLGLVDTSYIFELFDFG